MKKTKATAFTAALFAAAMSATAYANAAGDRPAEGASSPADDSSESNFDSIANRYGLTPLEITTETQPVAQPLYGPPWIFYPTEPGTDLDAEDPTEPYDPYYEIQQPAYAPLPTYAGDIDLDMKVDAFDLALMRMEYLEGNKYPYHFDNYDVNRDGVFDVKDIKTLQKFLSGDLPSFDDPIADEPTEFATEPAPLYGPPPAYYLNSKE